MFPACQGNLIRVDQKSILCIQTKTFDVIFFYIVVKTVVLGGADGIKLIDLHKLKLFQGRLLNIGNPILASQFHHLFSIPVLEQMTCPFDKVFWCLPGGQTDHSVGILIHPFKKTKGGEQAH